MILAAKFSFYIRCFCTSAGSCCIISHYKQAQSLFSILLRYIIIQRLGLCKCCSPVQTSPGCKTIGLSMADCPTHMNEYLPKLSWLEPGLHMYSSSNPFLAMITEFLLPCLVTRREKKFVIYLMENKIT